MEFHNRAIVEGGKTGGVLIELQAQTRLILVCVFSDSLPLKEK
jgi:hypothetical protein